MTDKPREFWIRLYHSCQMGETFMSDSEDDEATHLVEFPAYAKALDEIERHEKIYQEYFTANQVWMQRAERAESAVRSFREVIKSIRVMEAHLGKAHVNMMDKALDETKEFDHV